MSRDPRGHRVRPRHALCDVSCMTRQVTGHLCRGKEDQKPDGRNRRQGKVGGTMSFARVCVIEDHEPTRVTVRYLLEDVGYQVIEAANGLVGHATLRNSPERLVVVLDHTLPALDGCDLLELVARDEELRERHVVVF